MTGTSGRTPPITEVLQNLSERVQRWWHDGRADRTRARTTVMYQSLFGIVVLISVLVTLMDAGHVRLPMLVAGATLVFTVTGATLVIPWNRLAPPVTAIVPIIDVVIVAVLREAAPNTGFTLLWVFPAMWLASSFLLPGLVLAALLIPLLYWAGIIFAPEPRFSLVSVLLPLMIVVAAVASYSTARRTVAQRALLEEQARQFGVAVRRAREQEDLVTEVLDAVDFGVIRISEAGGFEFSNLAQRRVERRLAELVDEGARLYAADGLSMLPVEDEPLTRARAGDAFEHEIVWWGAPGEKRIALSVTARRVVENGVDVGALVVSEDVTREITALRARDDLVASVSHELRTPLTSILGYVDLMMDDDLSPSTRRGPEVVERNGNRLLMMISDILISARDHATGTALSVEPADGDVADVIAASVEAFQARATDRRLTIDTTGVESAHAWIDAGRIRQVVDNLIGNAIAYHDRQDGTIWIGSTFDGAHVWIIVRDDGPGIAAEDRAHLFERFYRADAVRTSTAHGSGLGLAISRDLVRAHGGEITLHSELGQGSSFVVRLPATRSEREA